MLTHPQWEFVTFILGQIPKESIKISIIDTRLKMTNARLKLRRPGDKELTCPNFIKESDKSKAIPDYLQV